MSDNPERSNLTTRKTLALALEFGFIIALPLVAFSLLGKWLAEKYDTKLFLYAGILLAVTSSTLWLYRRMKEIFDEIKEQDTKK